MRVVVPHHTPSSELNKHQSVGGNYLIVRKRLVTHGIREQFHPFVHILSTDQDRSSRFNRKIHETQVFAGDLAILPRQIILLWRFIGYVFQQKKLRCPEFPARSWAPRQHCQPPALRSVAADVSSSHVSWLGPWVDRTEWVDFMGSAMVCDSQIRQMVLVQLERVSYIK